MKRLLYFMSVTAVLSLILAACNMGVPGPGAAGLNATEPPATEPGGIADTGIVPIDLAGPPMEVGSFYTYVDGSILAAVPAGSFKMGFNNFFDSKEHTVTVSDYWIYTSEVTNQQYALCVDAGKCTPPDPTSNPTFDNYRYYGYPAVGVNYQQATDYCAFVHGRLPTEAEWEKGARGEVSNPFPWGDEAPACSLLNFDFCEDGTKGVKSYPDGVSYYGLFDMSGNVKEWVADWYKPDYFEGTEGASDPLGPELGDKRSVRSSSFADSADFAFAAHRFSLRPVDHLPDLGFRCVVDDPTYFAPLCTTLAFIGTGPNGEPSDCVPEVTCNDVSINMEKNCHAFHDPYTIITFNVDDDGTIWSYDQADCSPYNNPDQFVCEGPPDTGFGPVSVLGSSQVINSCEPSCPDENYSLQEDGTCKWNGNRMPGTECIVGTTYDPLLQCCSADPASGVNYNMCPGGFDLVNGQCVEACACDIDSQSETIAYAPCTPPESGGGEPTCDPLTDPNACDPGDPGGNSCPNPPTCGSCDMLDLRTCSCVFDPNSNC
jgi:formylglycine-generating enzyme required for sulfatase activity